MHDLTDSLGIKMLHSTPYYAQANGQVEARNKGIINILKKMVQDNPRDWHNLLSETLWAFRTSKRTATGTTTPFALTYGHDTILPVEVRLKSLRFAAQNEMAAEEYTQAMIQELEDLDQETMDT
ncbi:hypothetical protein ACLB2K_004455 [Fragaria x ananassa]